MKLPLAALGLAALGALVMAMAGPAYRLGVPLPSALTVFRLGGHIGLVAAVLGLAAAVMAYRKQLRRVLALSAAAALFGLAVFVIAFVGQRRADTAPPLHDISTDLENPPSFAAIVPLRAETDNTLERAPIMAQQQREGYPALQPLTLAIPADQAYDRALAAAQAQGWEIVTADKSAGRIEATDTTAWFGFQDDVVVRLTPWGSGTRVDMRSASRIGRSDSGRNARRIDDFLASLEP